MSTLSGDPLHPNSGQHSVILTRMIHNRSSSRGFPPFMASTSPDVPVNIAKLPSDSPKIACSPATYDQSFLLLNQNLNEICRKTSSGSNSSITSSSPVSFLQEIRPKSIFSDQGQANKSVDMTTKPVEVPRVIEGANVKITIRIKHEETKNLLQENLNRIITSSSGVPSSPIISVRKKLTDVEDLKKTRYRLKINTSKYPSDDSSLFYISIDNKTRFLKVCHVATTPDDEENLTTVLHGSPVPEHVTVNKLLCSFMQGPSLYLRPSTSLVSSSFLFTKFTYIPIYHIDDEQLIFTLTLKVPKEIQLEHLEILRVDHMLVIKKSSRLSQGSEGKAGFELQLKLPEDCESRSLVAYVNEERILVVTGNLSPLLRRMTCNF